MMKHPFDTADPGDSVELVQRFVDQELSAEECVQFLSRLGRDEALRLRTIELERLVLDASRLPRPIVPDGFAAGVMERLERVEPLMDVVPTFRLRSASARLAVASAEAVRSASSTTWRRLSNALFAPRAIRWNLAGGMATASVAVLVVAAIVMRSGSGIMPVSSTPPTTLVRLVIMQPGATTVQAAGDFNGWNPARTPLEQIAAGAWAVTIPLRPGRYAYMFVVDGKQWVADPFAAEQKDDGFGSRNAVLEVRPPETRPGASL